MVSAVSFGFEFNDDLVGRWIKHFGTVLRGNHRASHSEQGSPLVGLRGFTNRVSVHRSHASRR